jgi:hypothetical protein
MTPEALAEKLTHNLDRYAAQDTGAMDGRQLSLLRRAVLPFCQKLHDGGATSAGYEMLGPYPPVEILAMAAVVDKAWAPGNRTVVLASSTVRIRVSWEHRLAMDDLQSCGIDRDAEWVARVADEAAMTVQTTLRRLAGAGEATELLGVYLPPYFPLAVPTPEDSSCQRSLMIRYARA